MRRSLTAFALAALTLLAPTVSPARAQQGTVACRSIDNEMAPIAMRVGERLDVGLESNPSTGYSWGLRPPDVPGAFSGLGPARVATPHAQPGGPPIVGASGQECFGLIANIPGTYTISFSYRRPFEPATVPPVRTKEITIIVLPGSAPVQIPRAALPDDLPG